MGTKKRSYASAIFGVASQELSGEFSHSLQALAPLQRPVMEAECGPDQGS